MMSTLAGTPIWVWLLLAYIVRTGIRASRQRTVRPAVLAMLPAVLLAISLWHMMQGEAGSLGLACWTGGLAAGGSAGWVLGRHLYLRREGDLLRVSGSWLVLATSALFFGVHYWLGYQQAVNPLVLHEWPLNAIAPAASALGGGLLVGRAAALLWRFIGDQREVAL